ncbi:hypothetical protein [Streptomyces zagrosensis]|uniref:Holin n=1 Tax=Streptomyces zagrosensis TaxID=1042984 RepID=A0A7W9QH58_9ACTN|nr:hypothetical protein [Streptomyces zagrosensis]MBB5940071.1 hypothetical protein [Streptomyces zagrosensis]
MTDANRRTIRTLVQTGLALAAALPLLVEAAVPGAAAALAVATLFTKVMSLGAVDALLPAWLRRSAAGEEEAAG